MDSFSTIIQTLCSDLGEQLETSANTREHAKIAYAYGCAHQLLSALLEVEGKDKISSYRPACVIGNRMRSFSNMTTAE